MLGRRPLSSVGCDANTLRLSEPASPSSEGAEERAGQAREPPEDGGGVGLHHEQREDGAVEAEERGEQDAGEPGGGAAQRPGERAQPPGREAGRLDQLAVVDQRPHRRADPVVPEEDREPDEDDERRSATMISWSQPTVVTEVERSRPGRRGTGGTRLAVAPKIATAPPCSTMSSPIVSTIFVAWAAWSTPRNSSRSMTMPRAGASTPSAISTTASQVGSPASSRST